MSKEGASPQQSQMRNKSLARRMREGLPQYLGISPYYLLYLTFSAMPVAFTAWLAFQRWDGFGLEGAQFVGLDNFRYLISDTVFWHAVSNTFILWFMSTVPTLVLAMLVALMLNASIRYSTTFKVMYFLPNITSIVAMGVLFGSIFSSRFGLLNGLLYTLGIDPVPWMQTEWGTKVAIASLSVWAWVGYNALIYLAGLQAVPHELYESAKLDGANTWQTFWNITLPQIQPIVLFTIIMSTIGGMQSFTEAQVMTSGNSTNSLSAGGTGQSGLTMVLYFWAVAFKDNNYGYGAAIAWAVFVIVMLFTIINWRLTRRKSS